MNPNNNDRYNQNGGMGNSTMNRSMMMSQNQYAPQTPSQQMPASPQQPPVPDK